jgi:hypothetical protein
MTLLSEAFLWFFYIGHRNLDAIFTKLDISFFPHQQTRETPCQTEVI